MKNFNPVRLVFLSVVSIFFLPSSTSAQSVRFGDVMFHFDPGMSLHQTTSTITLFGQPATENTDGALSLHLGGALEIGLGRRVGLGFFADYVDYVEDPEVRDPNEEFARALILGPMINFYFVNKEDFNLFFTLGGGYSQLKITDDQEKGEYDFVGSHWRTGLGFRYFITPHIGLTGKTLFSFHQHKIDDFMVQNVRFDVSADSWKLKHAGIQLNLGLTIKL